MPEMNINQRRAVEFRDGPLLLLAGPGSGKTFVLTHRIQKLILSGVDSSDILVITFTKAAAVQMQDRFEKLIAPKFHSVTFGTFHAIFYSILKSHITYRNVIPITEKEKTNMLKRALEIAGCSETYTESVDYGRILGLISSCKNNGNDPSGFSQDMFSMEQFIKVFSSYNSLLKEMRRLDFDDMVNNCLELLKSDAQTLSSWQKRFKYILVDEFQDISTNQYELIKLLAYPENNLFVVGDDDQSIYGFRGSNVGLMRSFLSDFEKSKQLNLTVNYRSSGSIVELAGNIISKNKNRFEKTIQANRDLGEKPLICECQTGSKQNEKILEVIRQKKEDGIAYEEMAILVRTNRQGKAYAGLLSAEKIPFSFSGNELPLSSGFIRDLCAYLSLGAGIMDRSLFLRVMNKPVRYISRMALESGDVSMESLLKFYSGDKFMGIRIRELFDGLNRIHNMSPNLALHYICNTMGYDKYIKENSTPDKYQEYLQEKELFLCMAKRAGDFGALQENLEMIWNKAKEDNQNKNMKSGVRIMTYHGSKGLEFDSVILPDVNENVIPPKTAKSVETIEEERRMFYVACTRAKDYLYILFRLDEGRKVSRFML